MSQGDGSPDSLFYELKNRCCDVQQRFYRPILNHGSIYFSRKDICMSQENRPPDSISGNVSEVVCISPACVGFAVGYLGIVLRIIAQGFIAHSGYGGYHAYHQYSYHDEEYHASEI